MPVFGPQHRRDRLPPSWSTQAAYRAGDPRRQASREVLFGSNWRTRQDLPPWRAAWVAATEEFIVVHLNVVHEEECGPVQLLGAFPDLGAWRSASAHGRTFTGGLVRCRGSRPASPASSSPQSPLGVRMTVTHEVNWLGLLHCQAAVADVGCCRCSASLSCW